MHIYELRSSLSKETSLDEFHVQTAKGDFLKLIRLKPKMVSSKTRLLIVAGLTTVVESFTPFLAAISLHFEVHYLETREKKSSRLKNFRQFDMNWFSEDLASVFHKIYPENTPVAVVGYSLGAAIVIDAFVKMKRKPDALVLLSPTMGFEHYPKWSFLLLRTCTRWNEKLLKALAKWYIGNYVVNKHSDPEMYKISMRAIDSAVPSKIKRTVLSNRFYTAANQLQHINCKTLVVSTSKDGIHQHESCVQIANSIKGARLIDLETNDRSHGIELAILMEQFLKVD